MTRRAAFGLILDLAAGRARSGTDRHLQCVPAEYRAIRPLAVTFQMDLIIARC